MTCPTCGVMIPLGPLAAKCDACGFDSSTLTLEDVTELLKKGATERQAAERTRKRSPRR
jgi:hypothetical protein